MHDPTASDLAALHALAFDGPARWSRAALAEAVADPRGLLLHVGPPLLGFALSRVAADEAELLTLAVDPAARRRGVARRLLRGFERRARARGAVAAFLEVDEGNAPARALYAGEGWEAAGRRPAYYGGSDALILRKALTAQAGRAMERPESG